MFPNGNALFVELAIPASVISLPTDPILRRSPLLLICVQNLVMLLSGASSDCGRHLRRSTPAAGSLTAWTPMARPNWVGCMTHSKPHFLGHWRLESQLHKLP